MFSIVAALFLGLLVLPVHFEKQYFFFKYHCTFDNFETENRKSCVFNSRSDSIF